jgi:SNF2 family DNA or RNA helicase
MEIIDNQALVLRTKLHDTILAQIPKSKYLREVENDVHEVAVYFGPEEVAALKEIGFKMVPSAPLRAYNYPGIFTPMAHQRETAEFLVSHKRAFVFSDMGTGKSASAAWAADYLMTKGKADRVLIVCPVSIMQAAWQNDLFKTLMHRSVGIAYGNRSQRIQVIEGDYEIVIINYDGLATVNDELKAANFNVIIADEANYLKNTSTNRWKAFNQLLTPETILWLMTGTPAAQSPEDAYGLAKLVCPERVPKFMGAWRDMVMQKVTMFKWVPRPKAKETVFNALQPAIRFTKEECLDLPEIVYTERVVHMSPQQAKYYEIMKRDLTMSAAGEEITALNAAAAMNKLLQISCGAAYSTDGEVVRFDCKDRLNVMEEVIEDSDKRVIIFAPFTHTIRLIEDHLAKCGYKTATIDGSVSMSKRGQIIKDFQDINNPEAPHVIIIQPQAAAHGITLTAASTVLWFAPTNSVDTWLQANARAHRKGQDTKVTVVKLSGSPVEVKMYAALEGKLDAHKSLIELYKDVISS